MASGTSLERGLLEQTVTVLTQIFENKDPDSPQAIALEDYYMSASLAGSYLNDKHPEEYVRQLLQIEMAIQVNELINPAYRGTSLFLRTAREKIWLKHPENTPEFQKGLSFWRAILDEIEYSTFVYVGSPS